MRILLAYPGPTHSTYDVAAGYEKALRNLGLDVFAYAYHKYITFYSEALQYWDERNPELHSLLGDATMLASRHLVLEAVRFVPDVVLVIAGGLLHRETHDLLHRLDIPIVLLLTESPYIDRVQAQIIEKGWVAAALTNERRSAQPLTEETGVKTVYLPHAYDPERHRPRRGEYRSDEYRSDVFFHGTLWPERKTLFEDLDKLPHDVHVSGYEIDMEIKEKHIIDNEEMVRWYNGAAICLNHHRTFTGDTNGDIAPRSADSLGPRAYEIAACGAFQLCDDARIELQEVFGGSVPVYQNGDELVNQIEYYMARPRIRRELAYLARARVRGCTFENRAESILIPLLQEVT